MPDHGDTPTDIRIQPTGRDIGLLSPTLVTTEGTDFGIFQSFSGLLQPDRHQQREWHDPSLEYLTLQSLVVQHVRERTTHETQTETVERTETTVQAPDIGDDADASTTDSMTVREYIQQLKERDESESASLDSSFDASPERSRDQPDTDATIVQGRDMADEDGASDSREDQPWTPPSDTGRNDRPQSSESPIDLSLDPNTSSAWTTLDTPPPETTSIEREDGGSVGSTGSGNGGLVGPIGQPDTPPSTPQRRNPFVSQDRSLNAGPDLVVADSSLPGDAPSARSTSIDGTATMLSDKQTSLGEPSGGQRRRGEQPVSQTDPDSGQGRTLSGESSSEPSPITPQSPADRSVPLLFDQVEQPTLDRFVEQLSERLARHERIERERRGL